MINERINSTMNVIRYSIKLMNKTTVEIDLTEHFGISMHEILFLLVNFRLCLILNEFYDCLL